MVTLQPHAHLEGTLLPQGFFLVLGLIYLAALAPRLIDALVRSDPQLLALMFVVVLSNLLLQTVVIRRQLAAIAQR